MRLPVGLIATLLLCTPLLGLTIANMMPEHPNNNIKVSFCGTETIVEPRQLIELTISVEDPFRWEETVIITYYHFITKLPMTCCVLIADWDLDNHITVHRCLSIALIQRYPHSAYQKFKKNIRWETMRPIQ
jgi:hypothetical protein